MTKKIVIDVSHHQGSIDWEKVKNSGLVDGVIIRVGFGRDHVTQDDREFLRNVTECIRLNIPFGVYIYSYAKNEEDAKSEAAHVRRLIDPYLPEMSYPVYYDLEQKGTEKNAVKNAIVFGDILEDAGYWVGIYANQHWWNAYLKNDLDRFTKWVAKYSRRKPTINGRFDMWQFASNIQYIPGIRGRVDMSYCYRDFPSLIRK